MPKDQYKRIFMLITETGNAMFMPRSHQRHLINTFDNVASHSHHMAIIAYSLARLEGLSHEDGLKAIAMATIHALPEIRTIDLDFVAKHYTQTDEKKAIEDQLNGLSFSQDLKKLYQEFEQRDTLVSKCVKDADQIEQLYLEWVLMHTGNQMAKRWFDGDQKNRIPYLRTKSAKKIAKFFKNHHPQSWWFEELTGKNIRLDLLNSKK